MREHKVESQLQESSNTMSNCSSCSEDVSCKKKEQSASLLQECQQELGAWKDKYTRLAADLQNYIRRAEKEHQSFKFAIQSAIFADLLDILDNLERALDGFSKDNNENVGQWTQGIDLIKKNFVKMLEKHGIKEMVVAKEFNPEMHEAVMQVESSEHNAGEIVAVLQKGYVVDGGVLRTAKVSVAQ